MIGSFRRAHAARAEREVAERLRSALSESVDVAPGSQEPVVATTTDQPKVQASSNGSQPKVHAAHGPQRR